MRAIGWMMVLGVGGAIALAVAISEDGSKERFDAASPGKLVRWVQKYQSTGYENVRFADGVLSMEYVGGADIDRIYDAGSKVEQLLKAFVQAAESSTALKRIDIDYKTELVDRYNNNLGTKDVLTLSFDAREAMKYNLKKSYSFDMVETARIDFIHPAIGDAPKRYCEKNGKFSRIFCDTYWPAYRLTVGR